MKDIFGIWQRWNCKEITAEDAMTQIFKENKKEFLPRWKLYLKKKRVYQKKLYLRMKQVGMLC